MFDENEIETKKFQMYAEKADTVEKRIELCKKYLAAKNAAEKPKEPELPWDGPLYRDSKGIHRLQYHISMPDEQYRTQKTIYQTAFEDQIRKELVTGVCHDMLARDLVSIHTSRDLYMQATRFSASAFIWKDPNKK
jgi:hypothetical protein